MGGERLEHGTVGPEQRVGRPTSSDISRRHFFKLGATAAVIAAGLSVGVPLATLLPPKTASAEETQISGQTVTVMRLERTLRDLDTTTAPYRLQELLTTVNGSYSNAAAVPEVVSFLVTLAPNGQKTLDVHFKRELDSDPSAPNAGLRVFDLANFANLVKRTTSKDMVRVYIILEQGTFDGGSYVNAYILPVDASGNVIGNQGNGQHLAYVVSLEVEGNRARAYDFPTSPGVLLVEPNNQDTMACR